MEITWHGQSCFTLKGSSARIVIDPYEKAGKLKADIVTMSDESMEEFAQKVDGEPIVFSWPGEYESKGVMILAANTQLETNGGKEPKEGEEPKAEEAEKKEKKPQVDETIVTHLEVDGIKVCHLGYLSHKLSEKTVEALGDVDVLMIPVGNEKVIDAKLAHEVVEQIDPRVVIPMLYDNVAPFLKEVGGHNETQPGYEVKSRASLPEETTEFVVLEEQKA